MTPRSARLVVGGPSVFPDRTEAGRRLAGLLLDLRHASPIVLALPRGGVPVAAEVSAALGIPADVIEGIAARESAELERRVLRYRGGRPPIDVSDRTVILVDDGIATGATVRAAILWLRERRPRRLVLAVPVVSAPTARELAGEVDDLVAVAVPEDLDAIGACYARFEPVSDDEVVSILERRRAPCDRPAPGRRGDP